MGHERCGGVCPHCKEKSVWSKHEANSIGAFKFDACTKCGFIEFGSAFVRGDASYKQRLSAWVMLIQHHNLSSLNSIDNAFSEYHKIDEPENLVFQYKDRDYIDSCVVSPHKIDMELSLTDMTSNR